MNLHRIFTGTRASYMPEDREVWDVGGVVRTSRANNITYKIPGQCQFLGRREFAIKMQRKCAGNTWVARP